MGEGWASSVANSRMSLLIATDLFRQLSDTIIRDSNVSKVYIYIFNKYSKSHKIALTVSENIINAQ